MGESVVGGRYRLREALGGTMSQVFLAQDTELSREVVVKLLGPDADRARFEREARAAATLAHDNIVRIYAYGETDDGRPYMVFEHLGGGTLEERLGADALPDAETLRVARDVAAGLAHAHAHGLVHRDLKPANILFDAEGRAKVSDFGIARMGGAGTLTEAGTVLGTAAYISPEQGAGRRATPASDVYSFGVVLFRMLAGRLPFVSDQPVELVRMHRLEPPPSVSQLRPDVPARLESLVAACLAKDPGDRPPDGSALVAELKADAPAGERTAVLPLPEAVSRDRRVRLGIAAAALALLAGGGLALALVATRGGSTTPPASQNVSTGKATTRTAASTATSPPTTAATTTRPTTAATTETKPPATTAPPVTTEPTTVATAPTTVATEPTTVETLPTTVDTAITLPGG